MYAALWTPYPLAHRDFEVCVTGVDALSEHGVILLRFASSPKTPQGGHSLPPASARRARMTWRSASLALRPTVDGVVGTLCAVVDPAMPMGVELPSWAVRWGLHTLVPSVFRAACRVVAAVGAPGCHHAQRIAANRSLYGLIEAREREHRRVMLLPLRSGGGAGAGTRAPAGAAAHASLFAAQPLPG